MLCSHFIYFGTSAICFLSARGAAAIGTCNMHSIAAQSHARLSPATRSPPNKILPAQDCRGEMTLSVKQGLRCCLTLLALSKQRGHCICRRRSLPRGHGWRWAQGRASLQQ